MTDQISVISMQNELPSGVFLDPTIRGYLEFVRNRERCRCGIDRTSSKVIRLVVKRIKWRSENKPMIIHAVKG